MKLDGKTIQAAIMQIVDDYKFDPMKVIEIAKLGIKSGFKKDYPEYRKSDLEVNIDGDGMIHIYKTSDVVEEVEDEDIQMSLSEAKKYRKDAKIGEKLLINVTPENLELSRIAAQAAAQTIKQSLKNIEKERFFDKFQNKQGELLKARVIKVQNDTVVLDIDSVPVVLPPEGQIPNRPYELGEEVFVLLKQITRGQGGVVLDITQSTPDFVESVLRRIIPELEEGLVNIVKIARVAGKRSKILVEASDEKVDPI
jgi:N utilization substance protein A